MQRTTDNHASRVVSAKTLSAFNWEPAFSAMIAIALLLLSGVANAAVQKHTFTVSDLQQGIAEQLAKEGAGEAIEATVQNFASPIIQRASSPMEMVIDFIDYDARTMRWEASVSLYAEDKLALREAFNGRYAALIEVPVATRRIFGGEVIQRSDIGFEKMPEHRLRNQTVYKISDLVGKSARRTLRDGQPIAAHEVEAPVVAKRGDMLQISYRTPYIEIRTMGEALEDGAIGKRISVRNPDSDVVLRAVVIAPGMAEIQTHMQLSQINPKR